MLRKAIADERGRILVWALVILGIGALLLPVFLSHASTNLFATRAIEKGLKEQYAADAGVERALWYIQDGGELPEQVGEVLAPPVLQHFAVNNKDVNVRIEKENEEIYKITSTATSHDGSSTTIVSYVRIAESQSDSSDSFAAFEYAIGSLDGDIEISGSSIVKSDNYPELDGDLYANGNIYLSGSAIVYGDATAMGTINKSGSTLIYGEETEGVADPLVGPEVDTASYKAEAQNVQCAVCGDYTYTGANWDPAPGVYGDPVHAKNNMTINGTGTWTFGDTVCVGVDTNKDLDISGSVNVTFVGPVRVGRDLDIGVSGTVIFEDTVCVGRDLRISGSGNVIFEKPIRVEGDIDYSGSGAIELRDTVYVEGDMDVSGSQYMPLGGTVYVCGDIDMSGSGIRGGSTVIAEGQIDLTGSAKLASEDIPFVVALHTSTSDSPADAAVKFSGSGWTSAIVYAPNGHIRLTGSNRVYGALIGKWVSIFGSVEIEYPIELRDHDNWPDIVDEGGSEGGELEIITYNVKP